MEKRDLLPVVEHPSDLESALAMIAELRAERIADRAERAALIQQMARLADRVSELTALLGRKRRKDAPPTTAAQPAAGAGPGLPQRPAPPVLPEREDPPKKLVKPTGRRPLPAHLVVDPEEHRPPACQHCGGHELRIVGEESVEKLDTIREHFRRRLVVRKTCRCNHCNRATTAEMPAMPWAKSKFTSNFVAHLVYQKLGLHVPLDRMRRDFELRGVPLAISTLVTAMARAGELLAAIDGEHFEELVGGSWIQSDGSGIDVVIEGHDGVARGIMDVFTRDDVAVFTFSMSKDGEDFAAKLQKFNGTMVADAESRLNATYADGSIVEAGCNAHGRRKFEEAEGEQPILAVEGGTFLAAMFLVEEEAAASGVVGAELLALRQSRTAPIASEFRKWIEAVGPDLLPGTPLARAVNYYVNHWDALMRFLENPEIPMHNNASERLFRALDSGRLNWLFAGSADSAHNLAILMGLVATCRLQGIDPQAYSAWALDRRGTWKKKFNLPARDLTPAAYKKSIEQRPKDAGS